MKSESNIPNECLFCHRMTIEKKHLFFILLKKLSKELTSLTLKSENASGENESNSFRQLLRVVFGDQAVDYESICQHKKYYTYCIHKLKCTEQDFNYLSQKLAQSIAQKNYHLELLANQIKNSGESIAEGRVEIQNYQDYPTSRHKKAEKIKNKRKRRNQEFSQMQIKVEVQENNEANQVAFQDGGMLNSMSYIPVYNSQFIIEPSPSSITLSSLNNMGYYYPYPMYYPQNNQ